MITKYDVGQTALLKAEIKEINLTENDIVYTVVLPNRKTQIKVSEDYIADAFNGGVDGGKTGCTDQRGE